MVNRRLRALVSGRVQGVCYRAFVSDEARRLGLVGTVRNLPDGRVEVVGEGPEAALGELARRLRTGPPGAAVGTVDERWEEPTGAFPGFRIERQ